MPLTFCSVTLSHFCFGLNYTVKYIQSSLSIIWFNVLFHHFLAQNSPLMVSLERLTKTIVSEILPIQRHLSVVFTHEGQFDWT